jgi:hypothetical protein
MARKFTEEYFEDQVEISRTQQEILDVLKPGMFYHVIIIALAKVLIDMINHFVKSDEVMARWHGKGGTE